MNRQKPNSNDLTIRLRKLLANLEDTSSDGFKKRFEALLDAMKEISPDFVASLRPLQGTGSNESEAADTPPANHSIFVRIPPVGIGLNSNLAIVASGNQARDVDELRVATVHEERISRGICPNNCAPLLWADPKQRVCPKCHFSQFTNRPFDGGVETLLLRSDDHPEAGGREPKAGDVMYEFACPLEDGRVLRLQLGNASKTSLLEMIIQLAADEACEDLDAY